MLQHQLKQTNSKAYNSGRYIKKIRLVVIIVKHSDKVIFKLRYIIIKIFEIFFKYIFKKKTKNTNINTAKMYLNIKANTFLI